MPSRVAPVRRCVAAIAIAHLLSAAVAAQDAVVISCTADACNYARAYSPTVNGRNSVQVQPAPSVGPSSKAKPHNQRISTLSGLYRDSVSGQLRVLNRDGVLGGTVSPSKNKNASAEWTIEFRSQAGSKTAVSVSRDQFVASIHSPGIEAGIIAWLKREVSAPAPHPSRRQLITGVLEFAGNSGEMQTWRSELRATMQRSLEMFKAHAVDPRTLEATLADGVAAFRIYQLIAPGQPDDQLGSELTNEHKKLLQRFAIASALKDAGLTDAFLEKLEQIAFARWSRPKLIDGLNQVVEASAQQHYERSLELSKAGQYAEAFDEARIAANRAPCNDVINDFFYQVRLEFVHESLTPSARADDQANRTMLQQIVRELQSLSQEATPSPERIQYMRKRVAEGERLDEHYLPLQLKKAQFLAKTGELTASRQVVTDVERHARLGRAEAEEWLDMDATLNGNILTLRQTLDKKIAEQFEGGQFKEAFDTAATGLAAEPDNSKYVYWSAVAAAVMRDQARTRKFVEQYLRPLTSECGPPGAERTLFELYARQHHDAASNGGTPNWVSGARYVPGEAFYDPVSGSFNPRIVSSATEGKETLSAVFRWEGFLATSITTTVGPRAGERQPLTELEPVYDQSRVYMTGIGTRANSEGRRRVNVLRYLNSPEFDPILAARFTPKIALRGWAGNPFFHPFLWNDIFLFDLVYDDLGRIKEAIPVTIDASRPVSAFSERLTFSWDGGSKRLLSIRGAKYHRELLYDKKGRLLSEKISHPSGQGKIEYRYRGDSLDLVGISCEDNFFDRARRAIVVQPTRK